MDMMLVRYMSLNHGLEVLRTGLLKVLRPLDTNDPYEMMGACKGKLRAEVEANMIFDLHQKWKTGSSAGATGESNYPKWEDVLQRIFEHKRYFRDVIMARQTQQKLSRIVCFVDADKVDVVSDQLLWAHYGKNGSGIRIWFDEPRLTTKYSQIFAVKYQGNRPCIDLSELVTYQINEKWLSFLGDVMLTKSIAWAYEHEKRMIVSSRASDDFVIKKDGLEFIRIDPLAVMRVDFGPKGMIDDTKREIAALRKTDIFRHIDFRVATFDEYGYGYQYVKYDDLRGGRGDVT